MAKRSHPRPAERFMEMRLEDRIRTASAWANQRLTYSGIELPDLYALCEMFGSAYEPKRTQSEQEQSEYEQWYAMVSAAYALGFALGQQLPHFGRKGDPR